MEGAAAAQTLLSNAGKLLSSEYQELRGVGGEVAELRDELDAINALLIMQSEAEDGAVDRFASPARFGVNRDALRHSPPLLPAPMSAASTTANNADHCRLVGIEDQASTLAARLKPPVGEEAAARMAVFSIVGFGGLGKTTLGVEVCRRLEAEFPWQAMVSVSQAFELSRDLKVLLKDLLQQVIKPKIANDRGIKEEAALGAIDGLDENGLAKKLDDLLADKR
ncbi:disease resistance protein PIK6-NP-like [Miscanthus floridulus]|uniref:disease resistance protein PIK6-NP-like n=1 Tax=Miscanthus floridulus TaxID=154761 RepID=UPI00345B05DD